MNPLLLDIPDAIETDRLHIRCPRPGDGHLVYEAVAETLAELRAWPASLPWALFEPSPEASESFCHTGHANFLLRKDLPMLAFLKADGRLAASSGLHRMDWSVPKFEIGYWCRKSLQGRGLVTEAVEAITRYAFESLGAKRVESLPDEENRASRRVAERCGYTLEGILRNERCAPDGLPRHTCVYACTR